MSFSREIAAGAASTDAGSNDEVEGGVTAAGDMPRSTCHTASGARGSAAKVENPQADQLGR
jgi:hypothetical protein